MRVALDTNILAYAEGVNAGLKRTGANDLLRRISGHVALPAQVLGELYSVLQQKAGRSRHAARDAALYWHGAYPVIETSATVMLAAIQIASAHQLRIWDAIVLAAADEGKCRLLLSEDFQEGFTWKGVTVTNSFAAARHPLLEGLL